MRIISIFQTKPLTFAWVTKSFFFILSTAESEDEFVIHRKLLRRRHVRKHQLEKEREQKQKEFAVVAAAVEAARRNSLAASNSNNSNKRKCPSPIAGADPPITTTEATVKESMSIDEDEQTELETDSDTSFDDSVSFDPSPETYAEYNAKLPTTARRISLSPVSRSLAFQFDSISFFSPVRLSQPKRRKVRDTSLAA